MEIDKSISDSKNERLKSKYQKAVFTIRRALVLYSIEELAFSFNGGKDSTVLLHLLRAGYFLHQREKDGSNGGLTSFPIRTIYFKSSSAFPEINSFTYETASSSYGLQLDVITSDFKSGLEDMLSINPIRAIFLGVRFGDPTAVGQDQFSPSSPGWPPFMRVNPILDWSYRDVWEFILTCKANYCNLYDLGYTSIGSVHDTLPNSLLFSVDSSTSAHKYKPAYLLSDGRLERAGRIKKSPSISHEIDGSCRSGMLLAATIAVGDEILFGTVEDKVGHSLRKKLHSVGFSVSESVIVHNDTDMVAQEVDRKKSSNDLVFIYGAVGVLKSDVTISGVAKAFGVRLIPAQETVESHPVLRNEAAMLPESITELLRRGDPPMHIIKCGNVVVLASANTAELEAEWECLLTATDSFGMSGNLSPFVSKTFTSSLSDAEIAQPMSEIRPEFPDVIAGCYRGSRKGPWTVRFEGKDRVRVEAAAAAFTQKLPPDSFSESDASV